MCSVFDLGSLAAGHGVCLLRAIVAGNPRLFAPGLLLYNLRMSNAQKIQIIGIGDDGTEGLTAAGRQLLDGAQVLVGAEPLLGKLPVTKAEKIVVGANLDEVVERLDKLKDKRVVVLASGDPFWCGAGGSLAAHLEPGEWVAHPAPSAFSLAAARLGWRLEEVLCLGP